MARPILPILRDRVPLWAMLIGFIFGLLMCWTTIRFVRAPACYMKSTYLSSCNSSNAQFWCHIWASLLDLILFCPVSDGPLWLSMFVEVMVWIIVLSLWLYWIVGPVLMVLWSSDVDRGRVKVSGTTNNTKATDEKPNSQEEQEPLHDNSTAHKDDKPHAPSQRSIAEIRRENDFILKTLARAKKMVEDIGARCVDGNILPEDQHPMARLAQITDETIARQDRNMAELKDIFSTRIPNLPLWANRYDFDKYDEHRVAVELPDMPDYATLNSPELDFLMANWWYSNVLAGNFRSTAQVKQLVEDEKTLSDIYNRAADKKPLPDDFEVLENIEMRMPKDLHSKVLGDIFTARIPSMPAWANECKPEYDAERVAAELPNIPEWANPKSGEVWSNWSRANAWYAEALQKKSNNVNSTADTTPSTTDQPSSEQNTEYAKLRAARRDNLTAHIPNLPLWVQSFEPYDGKDVFVEYSAC